MVTYSVEVYDTWGRRLASYDEVPLLEVTRTMPDRANRIRGILPAGLLDLSHGYRVRVLVGGELFCEADVTRVSPQWSDTRKLILDRYVHFHEVLEFDAEQSERRGNTKISQSYRSWEVSAMVKDAINRARGEVHYWVSHSAYPTGAVREYQKFLSRKTAGNELSVGGIGSGQWVGSNRINASGAYAKDGDTIAGLVVDGVAWPDLRLMMIDCEETSRNSHAIGLHPEVADWTDAKYAASGYKVRGDAAKAGLQDLLTNKGIAYIELNPHCDASGAFDDRVDVYGRYIGLVYGGGECFNAAMVEKGLAAVYLYEDGRYHVPEMELKDYFSYTGVHEDSVQATVKTLAAFDITAGVLEVLTVLGYAAGGFVWEVDPALGVWFRKAERPDRVLFFDRGDLGITLGSESYGVVNVVSFEGSAFSGAPLLKTYSRGASTEEYGVHQTDLTHFSISVEADGDALVDSLLDDVAYPEPSGAVDFFYGDGSVRVGDLLELRGESLSRREREISGEWANRFGGKLVGRVKEVTHRFMGRHAVTRLRLTSPFRSVAEPLSFMVRSQPSRALLYQFRLDDITVGLDVPFNLD